MFKKLGLFYRIFSKKSDTTLDELEALFQYQIEKKLIHTKGVKGFAFIDVEKNKVTPLYIIDDFNFESLALAQSALYRLEREVYLNINSQASIRDIITTFDKDMHLLYPLKKENCSICLYFVIDISQSNLALARSKVDEILEILNGYREGDI